MEDRQSHEVLDAQHHFPPSATDYVSLSIQGYNAWPFNKGKPIDYNSSLDTGANSTYVTDRRLLDNVSLPSHQSVFLADGSSHPIQSSGTLVDHPSIHADLVPTFTQNLIGVSPILANGNDKMVLLQNHPCMLKN